MQQLETIKGNSVEIPRLVKRYLILEYHKSIGWQSRLNLYTNPESAVQNFLEYADKYTSENILYYKVVEVEVEIPFVPKK